MAPLIDLRGSSRLPFRGVGGGVGGHRRHHSKSRCEREKAARAVVKRCDNKSKTATETQITQRQYFRRITAPSLQLDTGGFANRKLITDPRQENCLIGIARAAVPGVYWGDGAQRFVDF